MACKMACKIIIGGIMKKPYDNVDYCGICPHLQNMIYYESHDDFQKGDESKFKEDIFCGFFILPIAITMEEYAIIPDWCPLDDI